MHLHLIHINYIMLAIYCIVNLIVLFKKWDFISAALSEGNRPSSKRIGGFILIQVVAICEVYNTMKTQKFDYQHLVALLIAIMLCWGIATVPQILEAWKGSNKSSELTPDINGQQ